MVQAGDGAPGFRLKAAVSDREVSNAALAGRRVVLVFHGPRTTDAPKQVGKAVRAAWPSADDVLVASIINLKSMGGLWKKVATAQLNQSYERMASKMQASGSGNDPVDYVVLCPDWDNAVGPAFGVADSNHKPAAAVLEDDGTVMGIVADGALPEGVAGLLAR